MICSFKIMLIASLNVFSVCFVSIHLTVIDIKLLMCFYLCLLCNDNVRRKSVAPAESFGFMWCFLWFLFSIWSVKLVGLYCVSVSVYGALKAAGGKELWVAGGLMEVLAERGRPLAGLRGIEKDYKPSFQRHFIVKSHACCQARSRRSP